MAQIPGWANRRGQLSKQTGDAWETQARRWLESQGLRFIPPTSASAAAR